MTIELNWIIHMHKQFAGLGPSGQVRVRCYKNRIGDIQAHKHGLDMVMMHCLKCATNVFGNILCVLCFT